MRRSSRPSAPGPSAPICAVWSTPVESLEPRRFLSAGVLDTTYASAGRAVLPFVDGRIIGPQPSGQTIVEQFTYGSRNVNLWRVNGDGTIDKTFQSTLTNFPVANNPGMLSFRSMQRRVMACSPP